MRIKHLTIFLILIFSGTKSFSQYRYEFGGLGGGSFYMGEANPAKLFSNIGSSYGALARYNISYRSALKVNVISGSLSGEVTGSNPNIPAAQNNIAFETSYYDVGIHYEYNFFPLTHDSEPKASVISPYIFGGLGTTYVSGLKFHLPFGLGFKYLLTPQINIGAEIGMRKLFSDNIEQSNALDDPDNVEGSSLINNDYYTSFGFFVTIGISNRVWKCKNR